MTETDAVNLEAYAALVHEVGDDPAFVAGVVDEYLTSSPEILEGMRVAVRANQPADLTRLAHTLKSSSASLGADRLAELCQEIELSARSGTIGGQMGERVHQLEAEIERVHQALQVLAAQQ
jgi:HPt (histidine-containing phosphotransfer) domain-containing protein